MDTQGRENLTQTRHTCAIEAIQHRPEGGWGGGAGAGTCTVSRLLKWPCCVLDGRPCCTDVSAASTWHCHVDARTEEDNAGRSSEDLGMYRAKSRIYDVTSPFDMRGQKMNTFRFPNILLWASSRPWETTMLRPRN